MRSRKLRLLVAVAAIVFLAAARPAPSEGAEFDACSNCHPGQSFGWCAGLIMYTVATCCGQSNQNGWAHCVNDEWGFYVNCQDSFGTTCQCDHWAYTCVRLEDLPMEGG